MRITLALVLVAACTDPAAENEVGVTYRTVQDNLVEGTFRTGFGEVVFRSEVVADGLVDVTFDRGNGTFGSHVDWTTLTANLQYDTGFQITADDRFLLRALVTTLENDIGNAMPSSDNLIRQANVWGHHPEGDIVLQTVQGEGERGWYKMCWNGWSNFSHDGWSHGDRWEYLQHGPSEPYNPCRGRCGPGCDAWWGTSAWTWDCAAHDRCEQHDSSWSCSDEFSYASDDFSFAGNCSY